MNQHVKVYCEYPVGDQNETATEALWAQPCKEGFKLDNIPFYAYNLAYADIVSAVEYDGLLFIDGLIKASKHSTVRLWFQDIADVPLAREQLKSMGCGSEISNLPRLLAVDIPATVAYERVKAYMDQGQRQSIWEYEEACLGFLE